MPADSGMAFVLVQHLDPTHESLIAELVGRCTAMPVVQVEADTPVEADHVYFIPPGRYLSIGGRTLRLTAPVETGSVRMPIDFFLRSLAADAQERAIGIVLSGTGTDGTLGLRAIKAAGGMAMVQDPVTAAARRHAAQRDRRRGGRPRPVAGADARRPARVRAASLRPTAPSSLPAAEDIGRDHLDDVLAILRERTKFDFRSYKRSTLERRIDRRMGLRHVERRRRLRATADGRARRRSRALFEDLLISVTSFFRDPEAWRVLQEQVIRPLVARKDADAPLRVWVPGCATGEEAYSIAMLLIEELQAAAKSCALQIFASDVDAGALDVARAGLYPESIAADVPPERLRRFFIEERPQRSGRARSCASRSSSRGRTCWRTRRSPGST